MQPPKKKKEEEEKKEKSGCYSIGDTGRDEGVEKTSVF